MIRREHEENGVRILSCDMQCRERNRGRGVAAERLQQKCVLHAWRCHLRIFIRREKQQVAVGNRHNMIDAFDLHGAGVSFPNECPALRQRDKGLRMQGARNRPEPRTDTATYDDRNDLDQTSTSKI